MNQPLLLHVVERLEIFAGKLPAAIQKPILHELTPLKELFLQQRPPRILLAGAAELSPNEIVTRLFEPGAGGQDIPPFVVNRWQDTAIHDHGTISLFDARGGELPESAAAELLQQPADVILYLRQSSKRRKKPPADGLEEILNVLSRQQPSPAVPIPLMELVDGSDDRRKSRPKEALADLKNARIRMVGSFELDDLRDETRRKQCIKVLAQELPNAARIEMARISKDETVQTDIAHLLVKSTTAICTAIGAQPIPLADLPVLTTLQLVMVSGIMYVSGRERSLRAATEFIGALGVNVGAGMLLREGARAILKFFPGWGNLVCGAVAGAGTYAIGRAATVFFIHGVSIKDARRAYLSSRKERSRRRLRQGKRPERLTSNGQEALDDNL